MDKARRQALAACYGAGQIKQAQIAGEYPPPAIEYPTGTISGRWSSKMPPFEEVTPTGRIRRIGLEPWPLSYAMGSTKLSDFKPLTEEQKRTLVDVDYSALERRVAAWHAETFERLKAEGYEPAGEGPFSDTWIKKEKNDVP